MANLKVRLPDWGHRLHDAHQYVWDDDLRNDTWHTLSVAAHYYTYTTYQAMGRRILWTRVFHNTSTEVYHWKQELIDRQALNWKRYK